MPEFGILVAYFQHIGIFGHIGIFKITRISLDYLMRIYSTRFLELVWTLLSCYLNLSTRNLQMKIRSYGQKCPPRVEIERVLSSGDLAVAMDLAVGMNPCREVDPITPLLQVLHARHNAGPMSLINNLLS